MKVNKAKSSVRVTRKGEGLICPKKYSMYLNIATWNVRTMHTPDDPDHKLNILTKTLKERDIHIAGLAETHWSTETEEHFEHNGYAIFHSGRNDGVKRQGVAIAVDTNTANSITSYEMISERLISIKLKLSNESLTILQTYAPDTSYPDEAVDEFYQSLQSKIDSLARNEKYIILGDFNAKVGNNHHSTLPDVVGKFGLGNSNERGTNLLQFCAFNKLLIANTVFNHNRLRRVTWISPDGQTQNQIDYIIIQQKWKKALKNCRSYHSCDIGSDHSAVIGKFHVQIQKHTKPKRIPKRYDVSKLRCPETKATFQARIGGRFEPLLNQDIDNMDQLYNEFVKITNKVTEDTVGFQRNRQTAGLSPKVEEMCQQRRDLRKKMLANPSDVSLCESYRKANRDVKNEVRKFKQNKLKETINSLEDDYQKNNSHNLFRTVRDLENRPRKPLNIIQDKNGVKRFDINEILKCWETHFQAHLNKKFPHDEAATSSIPDPTDDEGDFPDFSLEEVQNAIKKMKNGKSPGIDQITAEVLKAGGDTMAEMLLHIFKNVTLTSKTPLAWSKMVVTPIHKKGNRLDPENYRAISLLSIPGKVYCQILLTRMKEKTERFIKDTQFGFRTGRGTTDAIFIMRQIMEKARERNIDMHYNFIDFKAAFDTIWREALWKMLKSIGIHSKIVDVIKSMYDNSECALTIDGNLTSWFKVNVGVRQGCLLSPTLFNIFLEFVFDELKSLDENFVIKNDISIDIRYADDSTLLSAIFEKLAISTAELETACLKWGMKINVGKCKIISNDQRDIMIEGSPVEKVREFTFLGSVIPGTESDVKRRIMLASTAFGRLKDTIWSRKDISRNLKMRLYKALILPIATYASETWTLRESEKQSLLTFEMRCLRSILGVNLRQRLRNTIIRQQLGVQKTIIECVQSRRLKYFGHVNRRPVNSASFKAYKGEFNARRPRGRPPMRWTDQIRKDTGLPLPTAERRTMDREAWRARNNGRARGTNA